VKSSDQDADSIDDDSERRIPTPREVILAQARVDGWHGIREHARIDARVSAEAYRKAWRDGREAKARGEPCRCIRCWSGEVDV